MMMFHTVYIYTCIYVWVCASIFVCTSDALISDIPCGKCASHEEAIGQYCVTYAQPIHKCPEGFELNNGNCTHETEYCKSSNGTIIDCEYKNEIPDSHTQADTQPHTSAPTYSCPSNTVLYNGECVVSVPAEETVEKITCPEYTTMDIHTQMCVRIESPEDVCAEGFTHTSNGVCERISYTTKVLTCPDGYMRSSHDTCVRTEKKHTHKHSHTHSHKCPAHTAQMDAACVQVKPATAKCQDGFIYTNHQCVRMEFQHTHRRLYSTHTQKRYQHTHTHTQSFRTNTHNTNHEHINTPHTYHTHTYPATQKTAPKYETAPQDYVAMPVCPTGTIGTADGACLGTTEPYRRCPAGYIPRGSECTKTIHKHASATCPKPYLLNDGICVKNRRTSTIALCTKGVKDGNFCITKQSHPLQYQCPDGYAVSYGHDASMQTTDILAPLCSKIMRYDCSGESIQLMCDDVPTCETAPDGKACMQQHHHSHIKTAHHSPAHKQTHTHAHKKTAHYSHVHSRSLHEKTSMQQKPGQICKQISHKHPKTCTKELTAESTPFCFPGAVLSRDTCEKIDWSTPIAYCPSECVPNEYISPTYVCSEGVMSPVSATMCITTYTEPVSLHCPPGYKLERGLGLCVQIVHMNSHDLSTVSDNDLYADTDDINSHPVMFECADGYVKTNLWADVRKQCVGTIMDMSDESNEHSYAHTRTDTHARTAPSHAHTPAKDIVEMVLACESNSQVLDDGRCQRIEYTKSEKTCKNDMLLQRKMCVHYSKPFVQNESHCNKGFVLSADGKTCHRTIVPRSQMRTHRYISTTTSQEEKPHLYNTSHPHLYNNANCVAHPQDLTVDVCRDIRMTKSGTHCPVNMHMMGQQCVRLRHQSLDCVQIISST